MRQRNKSRVVPLEEQKEDDEAQIVVTEPNELSHRTFTQTAGDAPLSPTDASEAKSLLLVMALDS